MLELMHSFKMVFGSTKKPGVCDSVVWGPVEPADCVSVGAGAVARWALALWLGGHWHHLIFLLYRLCPKALQSWRVQGKERAWVPAPPPHPPHMQRPEGAEGGSGRLQALGFFFYLGSAGSGCEAWASLEE